MTDTSPVKSGTMRIGKDIPLSLALGLVLQLVAAVWFFADLSSRVSRTELDLDRQSQQLDAIRDRNDKTTDRLARLEAQQTQIIDLLTSLQKQLARP